MAVNEIEKQGIEALRHIEAHIDSASECEKRLARYVRVLRRAIVEKDADELESKGAHMRAVERRKTR